MKIKTFDELDGHALHNIKQYLAKDGIYPRSRASTLAWAKRRYSGWVWGDTIYFKIVPSRRDTLDTLIHEYVHWARKRAGVYRYSTRRQKLFEESLATWAAERATGRKSRFTAVVRRVARKYKLY